MGEVKVSTVDIILYTSIPLIFKKTCIICIMSNNENLKNRQGFLGFVVWKMFVILSRGATFGVMLL